MEMSSLVSTKSAQILDPATIVAPFGADSSSALPIPHYPSPTKSSAVRSTANHTVTTMATVPSINGAVAISVGSSGDSAVSPKISSTPKTVAFELLFPESPQYRARLPLRVSIYPHDTTDSIVTTVKNFYGLYSGPTVSKGVSFEDDQGNTLIARYENFRNNMVVYVRVIEEPQAPPGPYVPHSYHPAPTGIQGYYNPDGQPSQAPQQYAQHISRPTSRTSRRRSISPNSGRGRRSVSAGTNPATSKKGRSRSSKTRGTSSQANGDLHSDSMNGYSSGDGAPGSSSGKNKEQLGNTEISVDNIVEGGRRKRAKFESSELPLFAPPQMPAATSNPSVSPARRVEHRHSLPFVQPGQNPFTNPRPLQSPQSYNPGFGHSGMYATPASDNRRTRGSIGYPPSAGIGPGMSMMPTPDPTVGSCMSEEDKDVAMQLMRLGEMSNVSHGRASASTLDDTFSGRADAASSTGATSDAESDSEDELPPARRQKLDVSGNHKTLFETSESHFAIPHESVEASGDDADFEDVTHDGSMAAPKLKDHKPAPHLSTLNGFKPRPQVLNKVKIAKPSKPKVKKAGSVSGPMSPTSLPASRKPSVASNLAFPLAPGEDDQPDLSTKPRCQRCRKSKKGCDRQRPCGRCRDAGIPAELCISEDEGNGRKGRYGRHMGVPIKKEDAHLLLPGLLPAAPIAPSAPIVAPLDKNKKRKR